MYEWASFLNEKRWNYTINRTDDQKNGVQKKDGYRQGRYKGRELFIGNYHA